MLEEIMHYTQTADGKLIAIFQREENISPKAHALFCHVLNAQHVWACRILGRQPKYTVWENYEVGLFTEISKENFELLDQVLQTIPIDREISYATFAGDQYTGIVKDILFHVFNHSTYHRAQIATLFKESGITPPVTDFIILKRNQQL